MVAGDEQPPLGLEQADVRGRVARRLDGPASGPRSVSTTTPVEQVRRRLDQPGDARGLARGALGVGAQRLLGDAARARDLEAALERRVRVARGARHVLVVGVHPQLAAGALDDRRRLAVVVGCACVQTSSRTCSRRRLTISSARSSWASEPGRRACPVEEDDAVAATAQALQCGTPGQGSGRRSRQTPGSGALAAADARAAGPWRLGGRRVRLAALRRAGAMGKRTARAHRAARPRRSAPTETTTRPGRPVLTLRGAMTPATRQQYAATLAGSPLSQEDAWQRASSSSSSAWPCAG